MKLALFKLFFYFAIAALKLVCWLDDRIRFRFDFPRDSRDLVARQDWCVAQLRKAGALPESAEILSFAVESFRGDQAFRSTLGVVRIGYRDDDTEAEFRCVAKFAPIAGSLQERAVYVIQENHVKEIGFYQHLAADLGDTAPRAYYAELSRLTGHFCLLLEWLGDGVEYSEKDGCPLPLAEHAIRELAQFHALHWGLARPGSEYLKPITPIVIDFFADLFEGPDREIFGRVLAHSWRHNCQAPQTVIHGDPRVGNMIFPSDDGAGRYALLDWQCVRKGKSIFDVAYLLSISLEPELRRAEEENLLRLYHAALVEGGVDDYPFETLHDDYRHAVLLVLALLDLPFLVAEANVDDENTGAFEEVKATWFTRLADVITNYDYEWLGEHSDFEAAELRRACLESLVRKRAALPAHLQAEVGG